MNLAPLLLQSPLRHSKPFNRAKFPHQILGLTFSVQEILIPTD